MSSAALTNTRIFNHLKTAFNNIDVISIIQDYAENYSLPCLVRRILANQQDENALVTYLAEQTPVSQPCDTHELRKVCLYISSNRQLFCSKREFLKTPLPQVALMTLTMINSLAPMNPLDSIGSYDLFTTSTGYRFSIPLFIQEHKMRAPITAEGEAPGEKFLYNPLASEFFSFSDACAFIEEAIDREIEIDELHNRSLVPTSHKKPSTYNDFSLHAYYQEHQSQRYLFNYRRQY